MANRHAWVLLVGWGLAGLGCAATVPALDASRDGVSEAQSDAVFEASADAALPDAAPDALAPDVRDAAPEAAPDAAPEAALDAPADVAPDALVPDVAPPDVAVPDVIMLDVMPDVLVPDVMPDVARDTAPSCDGTICGVACVDTQTAVHNCGSCTRDCAALPNVTDTVACVAGSCVVAGSCQFGHADCDGDASNGCEADLSQPTHCGACGAVCPFPSVACGPASTPGGFGCMAVCVAPTPNFCDGTCADLSSDPMRCGGCAAACPVPSHGTATCVFGTCGVACSLGAHQCDAQCLLDTSVLGCGTSCTPCVPPAGASSTCNGFTCGYACNAGRADCDGDASNGCETDLSQPTHCGACGTVCPAVAHGAPSCDGTACGALCDAAYVLTAGVCVPRIAPPRQLAPLSTATVTSRQPALRWELGAGTDSARIQLCRDRACTTVLATFTASGTSGAPATDLPPGVVYWRAFGNAGTNLGVVPSPTWQFVVGARSAPVNTSWGTAPDVNGDGYADLLVGAPGVSPGVVYVYLGSAAGVSTAVSMTLYGPSAPDGSLANFGTSVSSAGDVNGDGYADVVVGAAGSVAQRAYVFHGGLAGLSATAATVLEAPSGGGFGTSVSSAGDLDGDGYADVVVGAPTASGSGAVYAYSGSASGVVAVASARSGPSPGSGYGTSVAGAGDLDGDGYGDVAVGAPTDAGTSGRVWVYGGSASGLTTLARAVLLGPDFGDCRFGYSVGGASDLNGDGYADLIVGAPYTSYHEGAAFVFLGAASGLRSTAASSYRGNDSYGGKFPGEVTGWSVAGLGDVNGDGYGDVAVVASSSFQLRVVHGGASAPFPVAYSRSGGNLIATTGDVNGDGFADLVGSFVLPGSHGWATLAYGSAAGLGSTAVMLSGPGPNAERYGTSLAWLRPRRVWRVSL